MPTSLMGVWGFEVFASVRELRADCDCGPWGSARCVGGDLDLQFRV